MSGRFSLGLGRRGEEDGGCGEFGGRPGSCSPHGTRGGVTVCPAPEKVNKDAHPTLLKDANSPLCQQTTFQSE